MWNESESAECQKRWSEKEGAPETTGTEKKPREEYVGDWWAYSQKVFFTFELKIQIFIS